MVSSFPAEPFLAEPSQAEKKCLLVSPHLDDAVLSCGEWIARHPGTLVATVFSATPAAPERLTLWDAAAGFDSAAEAMPERRREDAAALAALGARPLWLDFSDSQYGATPAADELAAALDALLAAEMPATVCCPAGLFHPDHVLTHQAMLLARARHPALRWLMYEDALYRRAPGALQRRLAELARAGIVATPLGQQRGGALGLKRRALRCYKSQLRALARLPDGYADAFAAEGYWSLETAPADGGPGTS
jgi:LmbE family N-acetylglucosaminyl deacetylase